MAKATGPLMSMAASGKLGGAIVFGSWKGRPTVRRLVTPSNPKSAGQIGIRQMFRFIGQAWASLSTADQTTYSAIADSKAISGFNAFTGQNQNRWKGFKAPSKAYPAAEAGTPGTASAINVTAGIGEVTVDVTLSSAADNWGLMIFRSTSTGFATGRSNLVGVITVEDTNQHDFIDSPLVAGTYYYIPRLFTVDGVLDAESAEQQADVT